MVWTISHGNMHIPILGQAGLAAGCFADVYVVVKSLLQLFNNNSTFLVW